MEALMAGLCGSVLIITVGIVAYRAIESDDTVKIDCESGVHDYVSIFDVEEGDPAVGNFRGDMDDYYFVQLMEKSKPVKRTYVKSVCRRCGSEVHRG